MARYEKPPDPRESELRPRRQRRFGGDGEAVPWLWLGLGIVVTVVGIGLALLLVNRLLAREPLAATLPTPTIIRLTAPPTVAPSPTVERIAPTPIPTFTPAPTRDLSQPPDTVTMGYYAMVSGTGNAGLTLRGGPSTLTTSLLRAPEGTMMLVIGGPEEGGDFIWWQVRLLDGQEGWFAGQYLAPAPAPGTVSDEIVIPDDGADDENEETDEGGTPEAP